MNPSVVCMNCASAPAHSRGGDASALDHSDVGTREGHSNGPGRLCVWAHAFAWVLVCFCMRVYDAEALGGINNTVIKRATHHDEGAQFSAWEGPRGDVEVDPVVSYRPVGFQYGMAYLRYAKGRGGGQEGDGHRLLQRVGRGCPTCGARNVLATVWVLKCQHLYDARAPGACMHPLTSQR
jgi:hypothetical protein